MILFPTHRSVFLIAFLCLLEGTVLSQEQADTSKPKHYKITGQVTDEIEKPIRGAKAWLRSDYNAKSISAETDEYGNFEIPFPPMPIAGHFLHGTYTFGSMQTDTT